MKILVLDDDMICRRMTSESLRRVGYEVLEANSGADGFSYLENGEPIVICITDVMMPEVSGLDFIARLRSDPFLANMPVLICTCLDPKQWREQAESFGIAGVTSKPVNANHIRGKVAAILQEQSWPLAEISRTMMRLDINSETYFECLDNLIVELTDFAAKMDSQKAAIDHEQFMFLISRLEGATRNLGTQRIADLLKQEFETAQDSSSESRAGFCSALKRETAMLSRAIAILKNEQSQPNAGRGSNQIAIRSAANKSRWRSGLVAKDAGQASASNPEGPASQSQPESAPTANADDVATAIPSPAPETAKQVPEQTRSGAARS